MTESDKTIDLPKQKRAMATRQRILDAGLKLFAKDGYHYTSSKKIAAAAGVATGTFYNHFEDKKALLLALYRDHVIAVHEEIERFFNHADATAQPPDSRRMMRELVELILRTHRFGPELHRELHILSFTDDDFATTMCRERENSHGKLRQALSPFQNRLRVDDFETANVIVGMVVETVVHSIVMDTSPIDAERLLTALTDMLHRYLFV